MKHILRDNAAMAWIMAIKYCEHIRKGRVTLAYRKSFVTMLHNAVELYIIIVGVNIVECALKENF